MDILKSWWTTPSAGPSARPSAGPSAGPDVHPALLSLQQGRSLEERYNLHKGFASHEGFTTPEGFAVKDKNAQEAQKRKLRQTHIQRTLSDVSSAHKTLAQTVTSYKPSTKSKNIYVTEMLTSDPNKVSTEYIGCYVNTSLTQQTDLVSNVNVDMCKMRAADLGVAGFALGNGVGSTQRCYVASDLQKTKSGGVYMRPNVAYTFAPPTNFVATKCRLGKNGQLFFVNNKNENAYWEEKEIIGCDKERGGGIKLKSAIYGANWSPPSVKTFLDAETETDDIKGTFQDPNPITNQQPRSVPETGERPSNVIFADAPQ